MIAYEYIINTLYLQAKVSQAHLCVNVGCSELRNEARKKVSMSEAYVTIADSKAPSGECLKFSETFLII